MALIGSYKYSICSKISNTYFHYENMPIQIYWKFYHQKMKIIR